MLEKPLLPGSSSISTPRWRVHRSLSKRSPPKPFRRTGQNTLSSPLTLREDTAGSRSGQYRLSDTNGAAMLSTGMGPLKAAVGVADAAPMYFGGLQWEAAISAIGDL